MGRWTGFAVAFAVATTSLAVSADEHVGRDAEKGDPSRWYTPADTPQQRYALAMKEARAAQAEAFKECRAQRENRRACEADAREQYRRDAADARAALAHAVPR